MVKWHQMGDIYNKHSEKEKRQRLRHEMPKAEVILWSKLKGHHLNGLKFRRQYSVGPYVIDFYCKDLKLAIEVDGDSHFSDEAQRYDRQREEFIGFFGIRFLRFTNPEVYQNLDGVLMKIKEFAFQLSPPQLGRG